MRVVDQRVTGAIREIAMQRDHFQMEGHVPIQMHTRDMEDAVLVICSCAAHAEKIQGIEVAAAWSANPPPIARPAPTRKPAWVKNRKVLNPLWEP